jgi:bacillopeptidase F (M6 metalloprotease family)
VKDAPGRTGDATLWSGNESNLDATAVVPVTVPVDNPTLTFDERHLAEPTYDYAYTVVSTDGGATYKPLANANTVDGPSGPALNGDAAAFTNQSFDLKAYAGKSILIGFRYVSDGGTNDGGWYVDNVKVGGTLVSDGSDASVFKSSTQIRPVKVAAWNLKLVGLDTAKHKVLVRTYDKRTVEAGKAKLKAFRSYPRVVAIVSYDEPTEQYQPAALYTLTVNGVVQPGGGQSEGTAVKVKADRF